MKAPIAPDLPDLPRWVEVRDLLLAGQGEVTGLHSKDGVSFVLHDPESHAAFLVGSPPPEAVQTAIQKLGPGGQVLAGPEHGPWLTRLLPGWKRSRILIHTLPTPATLPPIDSEKKVEFLDPAVLDQLTVDAELLEELQSGAEHSPIAATFVAGQPVSFCYAGAETESLWDVAVDTVEEHRRRGHALHCSAYMIRYMSDRGKQAVWQALEDNPASWLLAQKLGFVLVDVVSFFEFPEE